MVIKLETDLLKIWEQMNLLLGHKIMAIDIDPEKNPGFDLEKTVREYGKPLYILTPQEVALHIPSSLRINEPDPRKERVKDEIHRWIQGEEGKDYKNHPVYNLAEASNQSIRIYRADLVGSVPINFSVMQPIGQSNNTPVIYFVYGPHSGSYCHNPEHKDRLLQKMKDVGIKVN
jgi:hypothetical protein